LVKSTFLLLCSHMHKVTHGHTCTWSHMVTHAQDHTWSHMHMVTHAHGHTCTRSTTADMSARTSMCACAPTRHGARFVYSWLSCFSAPPLAHRALDLRPLYLHIHIKPFLPHPSTTQMHASAGACCQRMHTSLVGIRMGFVVQALLVANCLQSW